MFAARDIVVVPKDITEDTLPTIGSRAKSRYLLESLKLPTPAAFIIVPQAFFTFLNHENGITRWRSILEQSHAFSPEDMVTCSQSLQKLVLQHPYDPTFANQLFTIYHQVIGSHWAHLTISPTEKTKAPVNYPLPVIKGESALLDFIRQLWSAQLTPHALSLYLQQHTDELFSPAAIMVSEFEPATTSGTIITQDPSTHDKDVVRIEAIWGTNPQTDPQLIPGDIYIVSKQTQAILSRIQTPQSKHITIDRFGNYQTSKVSSKDQSKLKLSDEQLRQMTKAAVLIHNHLVTPQIINWLCVNDKVYFTRCKAIDSNFALKPIETNSSSDLTSSIVAQGLTVSPGIVTAPAIKPTATTSNLINRIAIYTEARPQLIKRSKEAAGIIIENGGITSELAMVAREIGIPMLVGTGKLAIKEGTVITLDGLRGVIRKNTQAASPIPLPNTNTKPVGQSEIPTTATKIYLDASSVTTTYTAAFTHADGISICSGYDLLCADGTHPKQLIKKQHDQTLNRLVTSITSICEHMGDRPVFYHPYDLDTESARQLTYGKQFEPSYEANPLLGYRGCARIASDNQIFELELAAIAQVRQKHNQQNCHLLLPIVRSTQELIAAKQFAAAANLYRSPSFNIYAEIGTPAAELLLPQWIDIGIDGILLNADMLAALVLGYDLNAPEVDQNVSITHPAVISMAKQIISVATHAKLPIIVAGYQCNQSLDAVEAYITAGATGITVSPPRFDATKSWIHHYEVNKVT
jgi:pyruvate,water dikinase